MRQRPLFDRAIKHFDQVPVPCIQPDTAEGFTQSGFFPFQQLEKIAVQIKQDAGNPGLGIPPPRLFQDNVDLCLRHRPDS